MSNTNSNFVQKFISNVLPKRYSKAQGGSESLRIEQDQLVFVGGSKYEPIIAESIESISYQPRDDDWQEVKIKQTDQELLNYYLRSDSENLKQAVSAANQQLKPTQPLCQFILSAKQGALSGKD